MKTFSSKSNANRAAKAAGLVKYEIVEIEGKFGFQEIIEVPVVGGFVNCPHCGIHLNNGWGEHLQEVNGRVIKHKEFEYECLACGKEFGPAISKPVEKAPRTRKIEITEVSTVIRPCKLVWAIAEEMRNTNPNVTRKEVMARCVAEGVAFHTARTQYQSWLGMRKVVEARDTAK